MNTSVIVCCYNKEKTIFRTLDSLFKQTIPLEIIIVNDCSTDKSLHIIEQMKEEYEKTINRRNVIVKELTEKYNNIEKDIITQDEKVNEYKNDNHDLYFSIFSDIDEDVQKIFSKIRVIHKIVIVNNDKNEGIFISRKIGIEHATCDYIGFVDADDYIDNTYFEELTRKSHADIVVTKSIKHYDEIKDDIDNRFENIEEKITDIKPETILNILQESWTVIWNKIFKRTAIINSLQTSNDRIDFQEDIIFYVISLLHAKNIEVIKTNSYYYYNTDSNQEHLSQKDISKEIPLISSCYKIIEEYIKENNFDEYLDEFIKYENIVIFVTLYKLKQKMMKIERELTKEQRNENLIKSMSNIDYDKEEETENEKEITKEISKEEKERLENENLERVNDIMKQIDENMKLIAMNT